MLLNLVATFTLLTAYLLLCLHFDTIFYMLSALRPTTCDLGLLQLLLDTIEHLLFDLHVALLDLQLVQQLVEVHIQDLGLRAQAFELRWARGGRHLGVLSELL